MELIDYQKEGKFTPSVYRVKSEDEKIKEYNIYFPEELRNSDRKYPVIITVNGLIEPAVMYYPVFRHLASWGFVVVGNQDEDSWTGYSAIANLQLLLNLNENENSPFYNKIDVGNIGILGHSEGGVGSINAINNFELGKHFKALYTASMPNIYLTRLIFWNYDVSKINIPYCMVQSTGPTDSYFFSPHKFALDNYKKVSEAVQKIEARYIDGTHNGMLWEVFSGYTAWFMWHLQNDEDAMQIFVGENAKILSDENWTDIEKNF